MIGTAPGLTRFRPQDLEDVLDWELIIGKTLYSHSDFNPRHKITSSLKEGLDDIIREVNKVSKPQQTIYFEHETKKNPSHCSHKFCRLKHSRF